MTRYLGVDVGASTVGAVVGDADGTVLAREARETPTTAGDAVAATIGDVVDAVCATAGVDPGEIVAAGVASMGPLDRSAGAVDEPPNLPVDRVAVLAPVEARVDADISLYNDATAGAVGERFYREAPHRNLVYLTVSTGIGAGAIVDGRPLLGATGNAVETGHVQLDPDGPRLCGCGGAGHWEGYASGRNLPAYARHLADSEAIATDLDLDALDARGLYQSDDPLAATVRERAADWHAQGVATLIHAYDPDLVAVGGSVAVEHPDAVVDAMGERLPTLAVACAPPIEVTTMGGEAGLRGALACALTGGTGDARR